MVAVALKSERVPTSRRAWSSALVSSAASNSETTSKENSATARVKDRVNPDHDRRDRQPEGSHGGQRQEGADARRALVEGLDRGLVVRVRAIVEVVKARRTRPRDKLVEHRFAPGGKRPVAEVADRLLQVVPGLAQLADNQVERLHRGRGRMLAAEVGDEAVQGHSPD